MRIKMTGVNYGSNNMDKIDENAAKQHKGDKKLNNSEF